MLEKTKNKNKYVLKNPKVLEELLLEPSRLNFGAKQVGTETISEVESFYSWQTKWCAIFISIRI